MSQYTIPLPAPPLSSPSAPSATSRTPSPSRDSAMNPHVNPSPNTTVSLGRSRKVDEGIHPEEISKEKLGSARKTWYLDLRGDASYSQHEEEARVMLHEALHERKKIAVVAGAGISVAAGFPEFRSPSGLFKQLQEKYKLKGSGKELFDASVYREQSTTAMFHDMIRELSHLSEKAQPTAFHQLLAHLAVEGRLQRLYTQNIDEIETRLSPLETQVPLLSRPPWPKTIQLHGGLRNMICQKCQHISAFDAQLFKGPDPPQCPACVSLETLRVTVSEKRSHGIGSLRPRIVLYQEHNPDAEAIGAVTTFDIRQRPDAVIVVGTSLAIDAVRKMVRDLCKASRSRKTSIAIWINPDPVPSRKEFDGLFDLVVTGDADQVVGFANLGDGDMTTPKEDEEDSEVVSDISGPTQQNTSYTEQDATSTDTLWPFRTRPPRQLSQPAWH